MDPEITPIPLAAKALEVPPGMVFEIACGLEDGVVVAERYGFSTDEWESLYAWEPFKKLLADKRQELYESGYNFKLRAKTLSEMLLDDIAVHALSTDATLPQKLEALKTSTKLADLEPKQSQQQVQASPFSIVINLNGAKPKEKAIEAETVQIKSALETSVPPDLTEWA